MVVRFVGVGGIVDNHFKLFFSKPKFPLLSGCYLLYFLNDARTISTWMMSKSDDTTLVEIVE